MLKSIKKAGFSIGIFVLTIITFIILLLKLSKKSLCFNGALVYSLWLLIPSLIILIIALLIIFNVLNESPGNFVSLILIPLIIVFYIIGYFVTGSHIHYHNETTDVKLLDRSLYLSHYDNQEEVFDLDLVNKKNIQFLFTKRNLYREVLFLSFNDYERNFDDYSNQLESMSIWYGNQEENDNREVPIKVFSVYENESLTKTDEDVCLFTTDYTYYLLRYSENLGEESDYYGEILFVVVSKEKHEIITEYARWHIGKDFDLYSMK